MVRSGCGTAGGQSFRDQFMRIILSTRFLQTAIGIGIIISSDNEGSRRRATAELTVDIFTVEKGRM